MFIAWVVRGSRSLTGVCRKRWLKFELLEVERRLSAGELRGMRQGDLLVSWGDEGVSEGLRVSALDGRPVSPGMLDRIERMVKRWIALRGGCGG